MNNARDTILAKESWLKDPSDEFIEFAEIRQTLDEIHALKKELSEIKMILKKIMGVSDENND